MGKHESRLERERKSYHTMGFVEGLECTKEIITNELKDAIQNGTIVIVKGSDKLFDIINSVGKVQEWKNLKDFCPWCGKIMDWNSIANWN